MLNLVPMMVYSFDVVSEDRQKSQRMTREVAEVAVPEQRGLRYVLVTGPSFPPRDHLQS